MNKKIIILISLLSISGISYFSYKTISKNNQKANRRQIIHQKKKNEQQKKNKDSPKIVRDNHQENNHFLFWIIIGIIVLIGIGIIIYVFFKKKEKKEYLSSQELYNILKNNQFNDTDQQIFNIHIDNLKNNNKYKTWECGALIKNNKVQIILCQQYNRDLFFEQLWKLDIEDKREDKNTPQPLKEIYDQFVKDEKVKQEIKKKFFLIMDILSFINSSILEQIAKTGTQYYYALSKMADNFNPFITDNKNNNSSSITLIEIDTEQVGEEITKRCKDDFNNKNILPLFKKTMNAKKPSYYQDIKHIFLEHFFNFFTFIYYLAPQLKTFSTNNNNEKTTEKIDDIMKNINFFLNA